MQTLRGEFFIKKDFGFYDSGVIPVVGLIPLGIYELLRRFVWRSVETGDQEVRLLYREGFLAAKISQSTLAELLGMESRQTVCNNLSVLKELGWVRTVTLKGSSLKAYVLGEVVRDALGNRHEVFYADAWVKDLWESLIQVAEARGGQGSLPTSLSVAERVHLVRTYIAQHVRKDNGEDEVVGSGGGSVDSIDRGVDTDRQGVSMPIDRECRSSFTQEGRATSKVENDIETTGLRLPPQGTQLIPGVGVEKKPDAQILSSQPAPGRDRQTPANYTEYNIGSKPSGKYADVNVDELIAQNRAAETQRMTQLAEESRARASKLDNLRGKSAPVSQRKAIGELEAHWREQMGKLFPELRLSKWDPKSREAKQIQQLIEKYDSDIVRGALTYVTERWDAVRDRLFKGNGSVPTIGMILKLHDSLVLESQQYNQAMATVLAVRAMRETDPYAELPDELNDKYKRARKDLEALGVKL